jgi:hypothetical protein
MDAGISPVRGLIKISRKAAKPQREEGGEGLRTSVATPLRRGVATPVCTFHLRLNLCVFAALREIFLRLFLSRPARKRITTGSEKAKVIQTVLEFYVYPSGSIAA